MADDRRAVAYHESAHALVAWKLHMRFAYISIVPDDDCIGHVLFHRLRLTDMHVYDMSPRVRDRLERRIITGLAGREGKRLITGRYNHRGAAGDYRNALRLASHIEGTSEALTPYFKWLMVRAKQLVTAPHHRPMLDALALALLEQEKIDGPTACQIILDAGMRGARKWVNSDFAATRGGSATTATADDTKKARTPTRKTRRATY
jgi:hypothetical protein